MREIKFRMWTGTKMLYDVSNVYECLKQQKGYDEGLKIGNQIGVVPYDHCGDNSLFLQYTGLKDKNEVEIYEGDIVIPVNIDDRTPYQIKWRDDLYAIVGVGPDWLSLEEFEGCEIIGNIYEHKHLLP